MPVKEGLKVKTPEMRKGEWGCTRDCVWKNTHVLTFISNSSKPLIIFVINLMVNISGSPVNHLFDGE
jgi:hypothetical protein